MTITPKTSLDPSDISGYVRDASSTRSGIVARAGGGQANATLIAATYNRVLTVATAGDSVRLPRARPGVEIFIANRGANSLNVFPATGDFINALAANAAFARAAGTMSSFICVLAGRWEATA